ncbi:hypothetical protein L1787_18415 [Acuticoccus sp. M5D2P5]|uniref:hypothetical protein n=1 Tax=Acuticoccus kalidii TaxID=2910977 RepID=UPI001F46C4C5|nr:hypothetical protein [Acuticoccus kalidii]MCF3935372.1 hypothetical protein [Acuticoccus kalidii]
MKNMSILALALALLLSPGIVYAQSSGMESLDESISEESGDAADAHMDEDEAERPIEEGTAAADEAPADSGMESLDESLSESSGDSSDAKMEEDEAK